jgi:hypothetical protein
MWRADEIQDNIDPFIINSGDSSSAESSPSEESNDDDSSDGDGTQSLL